MSLKEHILSHIDAVPPLACWFWTGNIMTTGYGVVSYNGRRVFAHRASYHAFKGILPDDMEACHICDTPSCVNPDHLFCGTHRDNLLDAGRKGRMSGISHSAFCLMKKLIFEGHPATYIAPKVGLTSGTIRRWKVRLRTSSSTPQ